MASYEMLCRGTAFCVQTGGHHNKPKRKRPQGEDGGEPGADLLFFTCSHVAAPWRWPKLYAADWLQFVRPEHTRCVLHVTDIKTGRPLLRVPMHPHVIHHDDLDVCVLRLQDPPTAMHAMSQHGLQLQPLELVEAVPPPATPILSAGFAVDDAAAAPEPSTTSEGGLFKVEGFPEDEEEEEWDGGGGGVVLNLDTDRQPRALKVIMGAVNKYYDKMDRGFVAVDQKLGDGICGAPVLGQRGECLGLVEGVVPAEVKVLEGHGEMQRSLANNMGFIYARQLGRLLKEATEEEWQPGHEGEDFKF